MKTAKIDVVRRFARALSRDVKENPKLMMILDRLTEEYPGAEAARFIATIKKDLEREAKRDYSVVLFPRVRKLFRRGIQEETRIYVRATGMGWVGPVLEVAIPVILEVGAEIYTTRLTIKAQKKIAEMQRATTAKELEVREKEAEAVKAQAEAKKVEAVAAMKKAMGEPPTETLETPEGELTLPEKKKGLPGWVVPVGAVAAGGLIILASS